MSETHDSESATPYEKQHLAMVLLVLAYGLLCMFFGELVPAGGGFGWDGSRYAEMVRRLPSMVAQGEVGTYYAQRILPSFVVRVFLLATYQSFDNHSIIRAFQVINLAELIIACLLWKAVADTLRLHTWGRWFGFLALFGNFQNSKMVPFYPVLTDTTAFLAGILMLWLWLKRHRWWLLVCSIAFALAWPVANVMGASLLLFLRDKPLQQPHPGIKGDDRSGFPTKWLALATVTAFAFAGSVLMWKLDHPSTRWRLLAKSLAFLPSAYLLFLGALEALHANRPLTSLRRIVAGFGLVKVASALLAIVVPQLIVHTIANPIVPNPSGLMVLFRALFDPLGRPFVGIISSVMFLGPAVVFLLLRFRAFAEEMRQYGPGYFAVVAITTLLALPGEPRFVICGWPFVIGPLAKVAEQPLGIRFRETFFALTILLGQWWLPLTVTTWRGGDYERLLEWPKQLYYMHFGLWLSTSAYLVDVGLVFLCLLLIRRSLSCPASSSQLSDS